MEVSPFLYLTTRGWKSGRPHQIEIWFVALAGRFYLISEQGVRAHWVQNLIRSPEVTFLVGGRQYDGSARTLESGEDAPLKRRVQDLFQAKYDWSDGLVVELSGS
jgi:deazaflavin-dependent oxidoreductase (nitroreductase family)